MTIGERIKKRREELGLSQEELALKLGYTSRSTINKIEKNENNLRQSKIMQIANVLQTTPAYIMGWSEETSPIIVKATQFAERQKKIDRLSDDELKQLDDFIDFLLSKHI